MLDKGDDPLDGLEERLQNHTAAFESLLALTPAREHFGSQIDDGLDPSDQWSRKKQTKEQKRSAKLAKLDPTNQKSALDVMKERERKRKRELGVGNSGEEYVLLNANDGERRGALISKKQKQACEHVDGEARGKEIADKRRLRREAKKIKAEKMKTKAQAKKCAKQDQPRIENLQQQQTQSGTKDNVSKTREADSNHMIAVAVPDQQVESPVELQRLDFSGFVALNGTEEAAEASSTPTSPPVDSPAFDLATNHSDTSSSSSIAQHFALELPKEPLPPENSLPFVGDPASGTSSPKLQLPNIDQGQLQERLRKRIEELRARRKACGTDGKPAKSRQELLEQRRKKEEHRKAHKKELRRQAKEDETRRKEEELRGSGSPLSADVFIRNSPRPPPENNFSFSRLAFEDGTTADNSITELRDAKKKKGAQDPRTALQAAEKKRSRLVAFSAEKRADIADKDMWLNAKKRAHGERVRDDTSLLKRALKRKEKQKGRSEKEWKEREQAVMKGREMKQKKREANLQKRRDEKGQKGKKNKTAPPRNGNKLSRPGFEGRFKA